MWAQFGAQLGGLSTDTSNVGRLQETGDDVPAEVLLEDGGQVEVVDLGQDGGQVGVDRFQGFAKAFRNEPVSKSSATKMCVRTACWGVTSTDET